MATVVESRTGDLIHVATPDDGIASSKSAGALVDHTLQRYCADGTASLGDSGAPVVHQATGKALGIVNRVGGACPVSGVSLAAGLHAARMAGYDVELRTV